MGIGWSEGEVRRGGGGRKWGRNELSIADFRLAIGGTGRRRVQELKSSRGVLRGAGDVTSGGDKGAGRG